jgi:hypothetical protein
MMAGVKPEEAKQFYEEDEDPARVFASFDAAEKGRTAPPGDGRPPKQTDLVPLRKRLDDLAVELRKLRLRDRVGLALRLLAEVISSSHTKVH